MNNSILDGGGSWRIVLFPNCDQLLFRDLSDPVLTNDIAAWLTKT